MNTNHFIKAALKSKFYIEKLSGVNLEEWGNIPFTTKNELRNVDAYDVLGTSLDQIATYNETSGTTGIPTPSWYSHKDIQQEADVILKSELHLHKNDIVLNRFPFAMAIPSFIIYWAAAKIGAAHIGVDKASMVTPYKRVVEIIERTNPSVLTMSPSEVEKLYETGKQMGVMFPNPRLRALVLAGELVSPSRKKYIESLWGVPVYLLFGSTETGGLFMTCPNGHYHLNHPNAFVEAVDEKGNPLAYQTRGNCVISSAREGMPLLRYYNQDVIELREGSTCGCGKTEPIMIHYGRKDDVIHYQHGDVTFYDIQEIVYSLRKVPFMWKVKIHHQHVQFIFQYVDKNKPSKESLKKEILKKLGFEVDVVLADILPLQKLTEKPAYGKYTYVEHTSEEMVLTK